MKIKLFYMQYNEKAEEFERRVNSFLLSVCPIDVKYTEAPEGHSDEISSATSILVLYKAKP